MTSDTCYQGIHLPEEEVRALQDIERATARPLIDEQSDPYFPGTKFRVEGGHVIYLRLSKSQLTSLPESVGYLVHLQTLSLSQNFLKELPEGFGHLVCLRSLYLDNNCLSKLPPSFGNLVSLRFLDLGGNLFTEMPEPLQALRQLAQLLFSVKWEAPFPVNPRGERPPLDARPRLHSLPAWLRDLTNLKVLELGGHALREVPESIGNLTQLSNMYLSGNCLAALPDSFARLQNLQYLHLDYNAFSDLPWVLGCLPRLQRIEIAHNPWEGAPARVVGQAFAELLAFETERDKLLVEINMSGKQNPEISQEKRMRLIQLIHAWTVRSEELESQNFALEEVVDYCQRQAPSLGKKCPQQ